MDVVIAGVGQTPVGEHWGVSLRGLANQAVQAARQDAARAGRNAAAPQALYIGNLLAPSLSHQANLGALLTGNGGMQGLESFTVEAAEASGAAAFHMAYLAISSGLLDSALVLGVEKYTDVVGPRAEAAVSEITDFDYEGLMGVTPAAQAGLVMQRYLYEYQVPRAALGGFALLAHANAVHNPNAMYRRVLRQKDYEAAPMVSNPLNLMDMAPYADGAAAIWLVNSDRLAGENLADGAPLVRVTGSSVVTDRLSLHDRPDLLAFDAARLSVERACRQAGCLPQDVDLFEVWDGFSVYAALALEAAGFAARGEGWRLPQEDRPEMPVLTMGGQKGRGNPLGASGVYQLAEAVLQLRGEAGVNQVVGARRALVQALGGAAATAVTHVVERV